jgi:WD40 repeat protein
MADLHWSPDDSYLIVHESGFSYKLLVYLPTKQLLFSDDKQDVLGIKKIAFSPDTMYLATLTCDNKIIIYNSVSWTEVIKIDPKTVEEDENTVLLRF